MKSAATGRPVAKKIVIDLLTPVFRQPNVHVIDDIAGSDLAAVSNHEAVRGPAGWIRVAMGVRELMVPKCSGGYGARSHRGVR